jgi:hypothetical protein
MHKPLLILLLLAFLGFSFVKPGQGKKVVRCQLQIDSTKIIPGNLVEVSILTVLKDSTYINSTGAINFADYDIQLIGGAVIHQKTRYKLVIRVLDDFYSNPVIKISVTLRRNPKCFVLRTFRIIYSKLQLLQFKGVDGYDPRANSENGYRKVPITKRVNLEFIDNTQTLSNNSDPAIIGGKGPDLEAYISLIQSESNQKFLKIQINSEISQSLTKYLPLGIGQLEIQSNGGKGGISKYGGKGGNGGNVTIHITSEAKPFFYQVIIDNEGGEGGDLWRPKVDGQQSGPYGDNGELKILDWIP